jgi:bifunctional non-homologous end joining protein LigD
MPNLERYREKRDPARTPEPFGAEGPSRARAAGAARAFVVQQHAARRMHWDLRLEIDGVLVSWAVPKGPSLDPEQRRLAVRTEDHPLEYADFEGVIPEGNYGAGAMIVWDRGSYRCADGNPPGAALGSGKLDLLLEGHKLRGRFALVRTRGEDGRQWLLLAKGPRPVEPGELVETRPESVLSGLDVDERRRGVSYDAELARRARRAGAPRRALDVRGLRPMLARTADEPFSRRGWVFELKYDGVRALAGRRGEEVRLVMRSGRDATALYPELARALANLPVSECVIDGEIVVLDVGGRASFERLQRRFTQTDVELAAREAVESPVVLQAFDLLGVAGFDLRGLPLAKRKELLSLFAPRLGFVRFADHVEGEGMALFEAAREHGVEGVVAKRADSRYETGRRSDAWRKIKVPRSALLAIVGYTSGRGSRGRLGSLMVAWHRDGELVYAGNVGSGLDERTVSDLLHRLDPRRVEEPAFAGAPTAPGRSAREQTWVEPELVCEVSFTEVTGAGLLRQPVFRGLRPDRSLEECRAPAERPPVPAAPSAPVPPRAEAGLEITRPEKVFWPVEGYTKGDLLAYYEAVWPWLAPYLEDRPVVLTRYPDGIDGKWFYQKNAPDFTPAWARRVEIEGTDYFVCNDLRTLLYVVNSGAIPLHVWSARLSALDRPDWLILDLDPKEAPFARVVEVARHAHQLLEELAAPHFVKTSGQDGLHVLLPLAARLDHGPARSVAEALARTVCAERPEIATIARPVAARGERVYVDYLQNGRGKLIASPFSVRPRRGAPVSMPLRWSQVTRRLDPARFTIRTAPPALAKRGDPLRGVLDAPVDVPRLLDGLAARLRAAGS